MAEGKTEQLGPGTAPSHGQRPSVASSLRSPPPTPSHRTASEGSEKLHWVTPTVEPSFCSRGELRWPLTAVRVRPPETMPPVGGGMTSPQIHMLKP